MMAGAQRKPPLPIGAPAITLHVAFWLPDEIGREVWVHNIEKFILRLYFRLLGFAKPEKPSIPITPNLYAEDRYLYLLENKYLVESVAPKKHAADADPTTFGYRTSMISLRHALRHRKPIGAYPNRYQTVRFTSIWETMPLQISIELHNEYFTLSAAIDLSQWKYTSDSGPRAKKLQQALVTFDKIIADRHNKVCGGDWPDENKDEQEELETLHNTIYYEIWDQLNSEIFDPPIAAEVGKVFGEFRGLLLCRGGEKFITLPGNGPTGIIKREPFEMNADAHCVDAILPFVKAGARDPLATVDYTFSRFLSGHCLHASALGTQPRSPELRKRPVTDLLLATHADPWQLGRLVDRGNTLGTLRLAALYDWQQLNIANRKLRDPELNLDAIARALPETAGKDDHEDDGSELIEIRKLNRQLANVQRELAEGSRNIRGGLSYRTERSGYYLRQFDDLVRALRIRRIEGFQRYDQFVNRRLGATFEFIETIGQRYERLQRKISILSQQLRTTELAHQTGVIERLQESAEIGFFAVLFPYYVSHVANDVVEKLQFPRNFFMMEYRFDLSITILIYSIMIGVTLALCPSLMKMIRLRPWLMKIFGMTRPNIRRLKWMLVLLVAVAALLLSATITRYWTIDVSQAASYAAG